MAHPGPKLLKTKRKLTLSFSSLISRSNVNLWLGWSRVLVQTRVAVEYRHTETVSQLRGLASVAASAGMIPHRV